MILENNKLIVETKCRFTRLAKLFRNSYPEIKSILILQGDSNYCRELESVPQKISSYFLPTLIQKSPDSSNLKRDMLEKNVILLSSMEQFIRIQGLDVLISLFNQAFSESKTIIASAQRENLFELRYEQFWHDVFCSKSAKIIDQIIYDGQEYITILISRNYLVDSETKLMTKRYNQEIRSRYDLKKTHIKSYLSDGKFIKQVCRKAELILYDELVMEFQNIKLLIELGVETYWQLGNFEIAEAGWITRFERNYIEGINLEKVRITQENSQRLKIFLFEACCEFAKKRLFPNDLRPWNCLVAENRIHLIDFPKNIQIDADCDKISNLFALVVCFAWLDLYGEVEYYSLLEELKILLCESTIYFEKDFEERISKAWFSLDKLRNIFLEQTYSLPARFNLLVEEL